jgi:hypothetical protein
MAEDLPKLNRPFPWPCGECRQKTRTLVVLEKWQGEFEDDRTGISHYLEILNCPIITCTNCGEGSYVVTDESADMITAAVRGHQSGNLCTDKCKKVKQ